MPRKPTQHILSASIFCDSACASGRSLCRRRIPRGSTRTAGKSWFAKTPCAPSAADDRCRTTGIGLWCSTRPGRQIFQRLPSGFRRAFRSPRTLQAVLQPFQNRCRTDRPHAGGFSVPGLSAAGSSVGRTLNPRLSPSAALRSIRNCFPITLRQSRLEKPSATQPRRLTQTIQLKLSELSILTPR